MEVQILKKTINTESNETFSYNQKKMRVAAYARVSTSLDDQINSFESQVKYYKDKISKNPNWSLVNIYTDEGITGTSTKLREGFNRMIKDACEGKIDLILTKSISRFARNTVDTIKYVRALKAKNVPIIFEEEHINTMDMNGELLLTVLSSIAQQESYNIGQHVRQGRQMKIENGERVFSNKCYGFDWDRKEKILKINPKEAEVLRKVYAMYLSGESYLTICRELNMEGITTHFGKKWETGKIRNMLTNEKYVGDVEYNKFFVKNVLDHREVLNRGEYKKVYVKNNHEGIINRKEDENDSFNEELFDELVDYGLIGAYDEGGRPDSYVIRFICKNGFEFKPREDLRENMIIENSRIGSEKIYTTILDFTSKQQFYIFKNENGRNTKTLVNQIRVLFMIER